MPNDTAIKTLQSAEDGILDPALRLKTLNDLNSNENKERKNESLKRFEIYRKRQRQYIIEKLLGEFSLSTVQDMRLITSINLTERIVNEQASIYKRAPKRNFQNVNDKQTEQLEALYDHACADVRMKHANRTFSLQDQGTVQVWPEDGIIKMRSLHPHHFDVIPNPLNPEKALAYIVRPHDKAQFQQSGPGDVQTNSRTNLSKQSDSINQITGDADDWRSTQSLVTWWSDKYHFVTDARGNMLPDFTNGSVENPIGELPFVDLAGEKDFEFYVRGGNGVTEFNLDFGLLLSDTANINRLQGYSQAVIQGDNVPKDVKVGPNHVILLPPNKDGSASSFQFVTPSPDMNAALSLLELYLKLFLTSEGMDPKTISGSADANKFNSGLERMLAMIEKFEASQDDLDLFTKAEEGKLFSLMSKWSNKLQGTDVLIPELKLATIPDNAFMNIKYTPPETIKTDSEVEESVTRRTEGGFMSRVEGIMELRGVEREEAEKIIEQIDEDEGLGQETMPGEEGAQASGGTHVHKGTSPAPSGPEPHSHEMSDGTGSTSMDSGGPGHTHRGPNGEEVK